VLPRRCKSVKSGLDPIPPPVNSPTSHTPSRPSASAATSPFFFPLLAVLHSGTRSQLIRRRRSLPLPPLSPLLSEQFYIPPFLVPRSIVFLDTEPCPRALLLLKYSSISTTVHATPEPHLLSCCFTSNIVEIHETLFLTFSRRPS
jgi:hypothetical protein